MKIAKITPLFKSDEADLLKSYRPIAVLPMFSKILERIMYNRIYSHVIQNNMLYNKQFGSRENCSTYQEYYSCTCLQSLTKILRLTSNVTGK